MGGGVPHRHRMLVELPRGSLPMDVPPEVLHEVVP